MLVYVLTPVTEVYCLLGCRVLNFARGDTFSRSVGKMLPNYTVLKSRIPYSSSLFYLIFFHQHLHDHRHFLLLHIHHLPFFQVYFVFYSSHYFSSSVIIIIRFFFFSHYHLLLHSSSSSSSVIIIFFCHHHHYPDLHNVRSRGKKGINTRKRY